MSLAEIILRIGTAIGGWLIYFGLGLTLAVLREADCDPHTDQLWRGTLLFAALAVPGLLFAGRGMQWSRSLRWLALPAAALGLLALVRVAPGLTTTTIGGASLCALTAADPEVYANVGAGGIERAWPVVQTLVLLGGTVQAARTWVAARHAPPES